MEAFINFFESFKNMTFSFPNIRLNDVIDIVIVAYLIYKIITIIKDTRAWTLFKGIIIIGIIAILSYILELNTVLWIISNTISVGIIAIIIIFQPELRTALEKLGTSKIFANIFKFEEETKNEHISIRTIDEVVSCAKFLAERRLGAIIILEKQVRLGEYETTGIKLNANVSTELLINIFEKNTPLHDGAVMIRDNMITYATCYLPLTNNPNINKKYGTRHRAAIGITEISDAIAVVVSEETGGVSIAVNGELIPNIQREHIRNEIITYVKKDKKEKKTKVDSKVKEAGK